ncbi:hypothetical protein BFP75_12610 [Maribacter sp. 4G9]|nr:hypothetical protein BFP75_12610 [Maribacter sp. 4G9]
MLLFLGIGFMKPSIYETARSFFVTVGLFLGPISYMWILSSEYQTNSQSISFLMLPGSTFEKWLAHMVIGVGIYYLSFLVIFRLLDLFFVSAIHSKYDSTGISYIVKDMEIQSFDSLLLYGPFLLGTIISLSVFIGALYFKKNSLVYSLITVFSLAMAIVVYHFVIISLNLDGNIPIDGRSAIPFYRVLITDVSSSPAKEYVIGSKYSITSVLSAMCIPIICALTIAYYYAIKEKEL